jgi:hypothetical protein
MTRARIINDDPPLPSVSKKLREAGHWMGWAEVRICLLSMYMIGVYWKPWQGVADWLEMVLPNPRGIHAGWRVLHGQGVLCDCQL